jgi:asparagine synthetase B (glutamine-hydrolysing)
MYGRYDFERNEYSFGGRSKKIADNLMVVYEGNVDLEDDVMMNKLFDIVIKPSEVSKANLFLGRQFGIVIIDVRKKKIQLIRDSFGIIPLYYSIIGGELSFGTRIEYIGKKCNNK